MISDGENGFLATQKDVDRIADRLGELIRSLEFRREFGQQARRD